MIYEKIQIQNFFAANALSLKNLENLGVSLDPLETHHHVVKRGTSNDLGYYALPLPPLPSDLSQDSMKLLSKPNEKLIKLANNLVMQKRQSILPPSINQFFERDTNEVDDPFRLTVDGHQNYPNR